LFVPKKKSKSFVIYWLSRPKYDYSQRYYSHFFNRQILEHVQRIIYLSKL
jgi:hypothetical protein